MFKRFRSHRPNEKIKARLLNRLRNTTNAELMRWADNVLTGSGRAIDDMKKSLNQNNPEQALVFVEELRNGALSLLAVAQVIEERTSQL